MASHHVSHLVQVAITEDYAARSPKIRALPLLQQPPTSLAIPPAINAFQDHSDAAKYMNRTNEDESSDEDANISLSAASKLAGQTVAPFLAKHIPDQYAPLGGLDQPNSPANKDPNTKYCYRHRPDLKCRRQANEPSMDQLQHVRLNSAVMVLYHVLITFLGA